jgi:hypothetical protein
MARNRLSMMSMWQKLRGQATKQAIRGAAVEFHEIEGGEKTTLWRLSHRVTNINDYPTKGWSILEFPAPLLPREISWPP